MIDTVKEWLARPEVISTIGIIYTAVATIVGYFMVAYRTGLFTVLGFNKDIKSMLEKIDSQQDIINTLVQVSQKQIEYLNSFAMSVNFSADKRTALADKYADIKLLLTDTTRNMKEEAIPIVEKIEEVVETIAPTTVSMYQRMKGK